VSRRRPTSIATTTNDVPALVPESKKRRVLVDSDDDDSGDHHLEEPLPVKPPKVSENRIISRPLNTMTHCKDDKTDVPIKKVAVCAVEAIDDKVMRQPLDKENMSDAEPSREWTCATCTYLNSNIDAQECEMCG
jgi:hypothetical protein